MVEKVVREVIRCDGHYRNIDVPCGWELGIKTKHPDGKMEFKIFTGIKTRMNNLRIPKIICPICSHPNSDSDFTTYYFQTSKTPSI